MMGKRLKLTLTKLNVHVHDRKYEIKSVQSRRINICRAETAHEDKKKRKVRFLCFFVVKSFQ